MVTYHVNRQRMLFPQHEDYNRVVVMLKTTHGRMMIHGEVNIMELHPGIQEGDLTRLCHNGFRVLAEGEDKAA